MAASKRARKSTWRVSDTLVLATPSFNALAFIVESLDPSTAVDASSLGGGLAAFTRCTSSFRLAMLFFRR